MLLKLKPKSNFNKNIITMVTGTTLAQAIPLAISPVLTRIYTPEDFGVFALYISLSSIFSVAATWQYERAIMLPKEDDDAQIILFISLIISFVMTFVVSLIIFIYNKTSSNILLNDEISKWLYFIPVTVLLTGIYNSFNFWLNRKQKYKNLSKSKIYQSASTSSANIFFGVSNYVSGGLIIGKILGQFVGVFTLLNKINLNKLFLKLDFNQVAHIARKYNKFPKITTPHSIFSALSGNLPVFIITYYFSEKETGFYSLASRVVLLPISLVSNAYYQVFYQEFVQEKQKEFFFKKKFKQVNYLFLPVFIIIWLIFPDLFIFVFGKNWEIAGTYTKILLPLFYLKFISGVFTTTVYIYYEKQLENFMLGIIITITTLVSLLIGASLNNIYLGLMLMSTTNGLIIFFKLYRSFIFTKTLKDVL